MMKKNVRLKLAAWIAVTAFTMLFSTIGGSASANLITNPSFEDGFTDYLSYGDVTVTSEEAHSGSHSCKITGNGTDNYNFGHVYTAVQPDTEYTCEGYFKIVNLSDNANFTIWEYNSSDSRIKTTNFGHTSGTQDWGMKSHAFTTDPNTVNIRVRVYISSASGLAYVDDISLIPAGGGGGNNPPVAVDDPVTTDEDTAIAVITVLSNDTDPDGDTLTIDDFTQPAHGASGSNGDGTLTYTPDLNYNGTDNFNYTISDGNGGIDTSTVNITVNPVNDPPAANDQTVTLNEDETASITLTASDADGDTLSYQIVSSPSHGTLTGSVPNLTYTPAENYNGSDFFTFNANDGMVDSNDATVTITVNPASANLITNPSFEDGFTDYLSYGDVTVTSEEAHSGSHSCKITGNGTDNYNFGHVYTAVQPDTEYTCEGYFKIVNLSDNANFTIWEYNSSDSRIKTTNFGHTSGTQDWGMKSHAFTTDPNTVNIRVRVYISSASGLAYVDDISLIPAGGGGGNNPPVANAGSDQTAVQGNVVTLNGSGSSDIDGDTITYNWTFVSIPMGSTATLSNPSTVNPNFTADLSGTYEVQLIVNDGTINSAPDTVTINIVALPAVDISANPVTILTGESSTLTWTSTHADTCAIEPAIGSVALNGSTTVSPTENTTYTITATGPGGTATAGVTVTIGNSAPVADDQTITLNENETESITLTAFDADGDALIYQVVTGPSHGTLTGQAPDLTYTPAANYSGSDTFTFKANDGSLDSNTATITLSIQPVNNIPTAVDDIVTTNEDTAIAVITVLSNDTDPDGDTLTIDDFTQPAHGASGSNGDGTLTYTPDLNYNGTDNFNYTISDGNGGTDTATVNITINPVNDAPVASDQTVTLNEDETASITLTASDADGDALTYQVMTTGEAGGLHKAL